jgi:glycosyltransferase involved in cell wall biosynthesis
MRIAILNWRDSKHPESGGAELYCHQIAQEFAASGHRVVLVTARPPRAAARETRDGYTIVRRGGRFTVYPAVLWWLLTHRNRLDAVVDSQNGIPFFSPLAVSRRTAVVLLMHHVHQEQFRLYFSPMMAAVGRWLESTVARRVYGRRPVAAVSPSTRTAVRRRLRFRGPIRLAPCGLTTEASPNRQRALNPRIVSVGRMVPHKQLHLLIEAMPAVCAAVPDVELHLVGDGPERGFLQALAVLKGVSSRVVFHGRITDVERDRLLDSAWLTVNTTRGEGWGLSVIEANQHGVPAIAFRVDGMRDSVVDRVTGWLVDAPADLGPTIVGSLKILADPTEQHRWEAATRGWSARFSWDRTAGHLETMLRQELVRRAQTEDRRSVSTDLATVVEIPAASATNWSPRLRAGDLVRTTSSGFQLLLHGIDHAEVAQLLERLGVSADVDQDQPVIVSVAGPQEVLMLSAGASWTASHGSVRYPMAAGAENDVIALPLAAPSDEGFLYGDAWQHRHHRA